MLTTVAFRSGAFRLIVRPQNVLRAVSVLQTRCYSEESAQVERRDKAHQISPTPGKDLQTQSFNVMVERWDQANQIFYGPERDTKNFPHPVQGDLSPLVRFGFIPDTWFQFFYNKTGVTGPYLFGFGLFTTLLSKEIWVIDHSFGEALGFGATILLFMRFFRTGMTKGMNEKLERTNEEFYVKPIAEGMKSYEDTIKTAEKVIWREEGQKHLYRAKKENIDLQLEAVYRQRLQTVHQQVKSRLDYLTDIQGTKRRFEQEHMVKWIVNGVISSITPQQEKETLNKCIADLKLLSQ